MCFRDYQPSEEHSQVQKATSVAGNDTKAAYGRNLGPFRQDRQPWEFVVLQGQSSARLARLLEDKAEALEQKGMDTGSARNSARCIAQAPVTIVVYNPRWQQDSERGGLKRYMYSVDTQSVAAAIQNMLLQAVELGLGGLWICDVFYAEEEISAWLGRRDELVAAVSFGWADESPAARPRKAVGDVTRWMD